MSEAETSTGQVSGSAAEIYEAFFVPALFAEWAPRMAEAVAMAPGLSALDVGCGTGLLTRALAAQNGASTKGRVVGLDRNPGMLAVARQRGGDIEWREGLAESLPFEDESFDRVTCQFGLMFFEDRVAALRQMRRVLRPGGRWSVAVWGGLEATPGYATMVALLEDLFGPKVADELRAPFCLGDRQDLEAILTAADLSGARIDTVVGQAEFPSLDAWIETDVRGWTLSDMIDDEDFERLRLAAPARLARFVADDGKVRFASPAHIVSGEA